METAYELIQKADSDLYIIVILLNNNDRFKPILLNGAI